RWWTKVPEIIPRALSWRRKAEFNKFEYIGDLFHEALIELASTKADIQSTWYTPSNDFFIWYAPRSPPISIGGLYGQYLNKRSATRAGKKKSSKEFHTGVCGREKGREASLIDRVHDLEGICETLLTLSKEVKSLRGRTFKQWLKNGDIRFRNRLFLEKIGYAVKIIDVLALLEDEEKFSKVSNEDAIRVCLLLSLEVIFMGRELV
nr:phospholipase-like, aminotransferase-like mobile domain protein [Tanacetum cinerariifolium]